MQNLWNEKDAEACGGDPLKLRVYTSRLLGRESALVLHGGGNTSVKATQRNLFGDEENVLFVKGSGWDLATIEPQGFAPVKMDVLLKMARLERLSDPDMVSSQKAAMTNPSAPAPSVEAILHAIIPFKYVDHTHSDAVVAVSNTPEGEANIRKIFGDKVLVIPYVMPGFILARKVYELTRDADWRKYEGMVLMHHGIFSFADDAKTAYSRMITLVSAAEEFLKTRKAFEARAREQAQPFTKDDAASLAKLRHAVGVKMGSPVVTRLDASPEAVGFSKMRDVASIATRGPLTPDHVIHTKRVPLLYHGNPEADLEAFTREYRAYFDRNKTAGLTCLDTAPRWAIWPGRGAISFGPNAKRARVVADICEHTMQAEQWAEALGGWRALPEKDIFEVEYWDLEQAKLKAAQKEAGTFLLGKVAVVTGAASGIGRTCAETLRAAGAAVVALDINPSVRETFKGTDALGIVCDVTDSRAVDAAILEAVRTFGGIDVLVSNAGSFPPGKNIADLDDETWKKVMDLNVTAHHYTLRACIPFLEQGFESAIIIIASKNVPAPGPGAAAYSAAKAALTQLGRVAALELGAKGIRVNMLHPNAVFDTGLWTPDVLANRAKHYKMSVDEYKTNNIMHVEVTSKDVANLACAMAGPVFAKTTGAQVAVDGGNDRVI